MKDMQEEMRDAKYYKMAIKWIERDSEMVKTEGTQEEKVLSKLNSKAGEVELKRYFPGEALDLERDMGEPKYKVVQFEKRAIRHCADRFYDGER